MGSLVKTFLMICFLPNLALAQEKNCSAATEKLENEALKLPLATPIKKVEEKLKISLAGSCQSIPAGAIDGVQAGTRRCSYLSSMDQMHFWFNSDGDSLTLACVERACVSLETYDFHPKKDCKGLKK